jgi:UDP-N-acetylglucosamine 1-carboxyvinyltransferase
VRSFETVHGYIEGRVPDRGRGRLVGNRVVFEYPSHTATDNVLMAAVLAKGTTVIENAAREPEVSDLADFSPHGGPDHGGGNVAHRGRRGRRAPPGPTHRVIPDRVVAATFCRAVAWPGATWWSRTAGPDHMDMLLRKLGEMGVTRLPDARGAAGRERRAAPQRRRLHPALPGVATDYKPFLVTMLSVADGVGIVTENLFSGRFRYVDELRRMGADIRTEGHHAVVRGVRRLSGAPVRAPDLRAGAALVLAGLVAEGETVVTDAQHVDRGYEDFAGKLSSLGADVTRA